MSYQDRVKNYLAYWLQLGKKVSLNNGQEIFSPQSIIEGSLYSQEFEQLWQKICSVGGKNCYLEGTCQTIEQLFSSSWEISPCSRCQMPIPIVELGRQPPECPCIDMMHWPNTELPLPRGPIKSSAYLGKIQQRLQHIQHSKLTET